MAQADIVVASMEILCKTGYLEMLKTISKQKELPEKTPLYLGQRAPESLIGTWVPGHPAEPYAGTKGNQKYRDTSAYFTEHYGKAVEKLRHTQLDDSKRGIPLEYFEWERLVFDECHEATCPGVGEVEEEDKKGNIPSGTISCKGTNGSCHYEFEEATITLQKRHLGFDGYTNAFNC